MLEYTRGSDDALLPQCDGGDKLIRHLFTSLTTPIRAFLGALGAITSTNIRLQAHIAEALSRHGCDKLNTMRVTNGLGPIQALEWIAGGGSIQTQYHFLECTKVHQSQRLALVSHWIQVRRKGTMFNLSRFFVCMTGLGFEQMII